MRKDFIVDEYQVHESKALGADCALLIVAALGARQAAGTCSISHATSGWTCWLKFTTKQSSNARLELGDDAELIGINNRNLHTFDVELDTTVRLVRAVPDGKLVVSESGIHTKDDVKRLRDASVYAYLVGEALMVAADPARRVQGAVFRLKQGGAGGG